MKEKKILKIETHVFADETSATAFKKLFDAIAGHIDQELLVKKIEQFLKKPNSINTGLKLV